MKTWQALALRKQTLLTLFSSFEDDEQKTAQAESAASENRNVPQNVSQKR